ncbi:MAG: hypothetical protein PW788_10570 [Micavibrio sp.]|nr:hypothetical protein [Micavibrio sp.]
MKAGFAGQAVAAFHRRRVAAKALQARVHDKHFGKAVEVAEALRLHLCADAGAVPHAEYFRHLARLEVENAAQARAGLFLVVEIGMDGKGIVVQLFENFFLRLLPLRSAVFCQMSIQCF